MPAHRGTKQQTMERANRCARILANGGRRSDCIRFAADAWGVSSRTKQSTFPPAYRITKERKQ